jgi:isopenicillin N synthase-like dioxygenase
MSSSHNKDFYFGAAATVATIVGLLYYRNQRKTVKNSTEKSKAPVTTSNRTINIPVIDFAAFFSQDKDPARYQDECNKVAEALHKYGLVILRDPRVSEADNNRFLSMMENYFGLSDGIRDARPQYHYQVGVTPENVERPRDHAQRISSYGEQDKPLSSAVPTKDPKWRFFWRVGPRPEVTEFPSQNMDDVVPPEFPEWKEVMDMWGGKMTDALFTLAEMAAVGFNMEKDTFTKRMMFGSHLLAPTGSNYNKYNEEGTVLAGFHYDLNFLTIHGKSRFPGLYVWTREGVKTPVSVPDGCLIVQVSTVRFLVALVLLS